MGAKIAIALIATWSMFQSILYAALAGASYAVHECHISLAGSRFSHILYVWYFRADCAPIDWNLLHSPNVQPVADPNIPVVSDVVFRMTIITYVFFAVNLLWLIASFFLLLSLCSNCCRRLWVNTWIVSALLVVLADFGASGVFIYDLVHAAPIDQFLSHFQITVPPNVVFNIDPPVLALPSIIMLATSSRLIVFWILNIVLIFVVCRLARRSYMESDDDSSSINSLPLGHNQNNNHYPRSPMQESTQMQEIAETPDNNESYVETIIVNNKYAGNKLAASQSFRYDDQAPRAASPAQYARPSQSMTEPQSPRNYVEHRYFEPLKSAPSPTPSPDPANNKAHFVQDSLLEQQRITIDRPHLRSSTNQKGPAVAPKPIRDSSISANPDNARPMSQAPAAAAPPEELRGQLPWSYFKSPSDISGPKRTFTHLREDEDLPAVPVPDYTLHFPRKDRPSANPSEDTGVWSGPEQRY